MPPSSNDHFSVNKSNLINNINSNNNNNNINKLNYNMVLQTFDSYETNNLSGGRISSGGLSLLSEIMTPYAGDYHSSSLSSSYYMDNDPHFYNQGNQIYYFLNKFIILIFCFYFVSYNKCR